MTAADVERCPEAIRHGPADGAGRCPWCRRKYETALPRPRLADLPTSDLRLAYDEFYDPDFGGLSGDEIARRYAMGQAS